MDVPDQASHSRHSSAHSREPGASLSKSRALSPPEVGKGWVGPMPKQLTDIRPGSWGSQPRDITIVGTRLFFEADDGISGDELWTHETTNNSTWQVTDIKSGSGSGYNGALMAVGTRLYFEGDDGVTGDELWAHEMTNNSTWQVADIYPGNSNGYGGDYTLIGDLLLINLRDGNGWQLWAHDPGSGETWLLSDVKDPSGFTLIGNQVYFRSTDSLSVIEIEYSITYV